MLIIHSQIHHVHTCGEEFVVENLVQPRTSVWVRVEEPANEVSSRFTDEWRNYVLVGGNPRIRLFQCIRFKWWLTHKKSIPAQQLKQFINAFFYNVN